MIGQTVADPSFTLGIEEEYLLVDRDSLALAEAPENLVEECLSEMEGQVSPEFLQCQIEVGTKVCANIGQAREDLKRLRDCVSRHAANHNLAPIAASCHPSAEWRAQHHTDKERYNDLEKALGGVARRLLICGMHVHVGLESDALRVDQLPQMSYFLPHLLALSVSSPFWQGEDSKLASYRLTIFDNLPRTGLPPTFNSWAEYERTAGALIDLDIIEDTTKIWWDLRPSHRFPTLETRICDVSPRMEDTLSIAALVQCLHRMLWRLRLGNQRWRQYDRFLIAENRWRAQRYGITEGLIDFGRQEIVPMAELVAELQAMLAEDAEILGCSEALSGLDRIIAGGTSAQRQRAVFNGAVDRGEDRSAAADQVVKTLVEEFHADL